MELEGFLTNYGFRYERVRRAFNTLLSNHGRAMYMTARFVGGVYVHRDHKGDPKARPPLVVVQPKRQREALKLVEAQVIAALADIGLGSDAPFVE